MSRPRALILRAPGTNCDEEAAYAWERAGATAETQHVHRILESPERLGRYAILTLPGGFSYGDDLGAGRIFATRLSALGDALLTFRDRGGLILGICNGFQVLVRAGLLPGDGYGPTTLTRNDSGNFEARWVRLGPIASSRCVFLDGSEEPIDIPVAHGEGKFLTAQPDDLQALEAAGQIAVRYVDADGHPTMEYPANPNGSLGAVAGICDSTGRVFGLMPHPERHIDRLQHPRWTRSDQATDSAGQGLRMFQTALAALS